MKCPNCNIELDKGICIKCGYMENGNKIERFKKTEKYTDIRIYNEDFDKMNLNQTKFLNFIMGPFYFSYRNHLITGLMITLISLTILAFEIRLTGALQTIGSVFTLISFFNTIFYITINRVLYMAFSNVICIKLDNKKIEKLKQNNNYIEKLANHKSKTILNLIINIVIAIPIFILMTILFNKI